MCTVEPRGDNSRDEELRAVGVLSGVGHGKKVWPVVLELEVLIYAVCPRSEIGQSYERRG